MNYIVLKELTWTLLCVSLAVSSGLIIGEYLVDQEKQEQSKCLNTEIVSVASNKENISITYCSDDN